MRMAVLGGRYYEVTAHCYITALLRLSPCRHIDADTDDVTRLVL